MDLKAYLARIQLRLEGGPSLNQLNQLVFAHVQHIPFENLDVALERPIDLDPEAVFDKLVTRRRGGYCFEQNALFHRALEALGYRACLLSARVRLDRERSFTPARTHVFNRVELPEGSFLADVGVGGLSPTFALRLAEGRQDLRHEARRLVWEGDWVGERRGPEAKIFHQAWLDGEWRDVCEFTLEPSHFIDRVVGSWYTSAHPQSHFRGKVMAARATATGRITLLNRRLSFREGPSVRVVELDQPEALVEALQEHFGLSVPELADLRHPALDWAPRGPEPAQAPDPRQA